MLKRVLPLGIIFLAVWALVWQSAKPNCFDTVHERLQQDWSGAAPYSLRVERRPDNCGYGPSDSYYFFEVKTNGSDEWREVMTYRHNEPFSLRPQWLRPINERVAYVYLLDRFAVTTDGGRTWALWSADQNLSDYRKAGADAPHRVEIESVRIDETGRGLMTLKRTPQTKASAAPLARELVTADFGRTWTAAE